MAYNNIELLAPAKNLEFGKEAINHGADALYIGAPAFGARSAATNTIEVIEELVRYAHLYRGKVFATVNTLLFDDEIVDCVKMINQLYNIGVDALIIQDLGLLECDLPPIELHASTQCHNVNLERIKFLEQIGFRRIILARETSIEQMREIRDNTHVDIESFVHGALCVSYSGQCYMSQYLNQRSGNRGCCSQPCRATYDLYNGNSKLIIKEQHLLSLRDFSAAKSLKEMMDAGITSFKIEGRLKDISYVKNTTAYYRQLIDSIIDGGKSSEGNITYYFNPDVEKTFNRDYTDYFLHDRQPMASFDTQKSTGKKIGRVTKIDSNSLTINGNTMFTPGDGICYFDEDGRLQGFLVNQVQGNRIIPNNMPDITIGTQLWRNHDQAFEKQLQGKTAERKLGINLQFYDTPNGFGISTSNNISVEIEATHEEAKNVERNAEQIKKQLAKMGDSPFIAEEIIDETKGKYFLPTSIINGLRRNIIDKLTEHRISAFHPKDIPLIKNDIPYPVSELDYRANVINKKSENFYKHHGVSIIEHGLEETLDYDNKALMTTKYCLRYELGCCLQKKDSLNTTKIQPTDTLLLRNNERWFRIEFDCKNCQMKIFKR